MKKLTLKKQTIKKLDLSVQTGVRAGGTPQTSPTMLRWSQQPNHTCPGLGCHGNE